MYPSLQQSGSSHSFSWLREEDHLAIRTSGSFTGAGREASAGSTATRPAPAELGSPRSPPITVVVAAPYRVPPPVAVPLPPPAPPSASGGAPIGDFEPERRAGALAAEPLPSFVDPGLPDPREPAFARLAEGGLGRREAAFALLVAGRAGAEDPRAATQAALQLRDLVSMGFPEHLAAGALIRHKGDVAAAAEACLSAGGGGGGR